MATHTLIEAAHGVERHDVEAVNSKEVRSQYAGRQKIYPKRGSGFFRNVKWVVMVVTMGVYYLLPWVRWDRGPGIPDQAFSSIWRTRGYTSSGSSCGRRSCI